MLTRINGVAFRNQEELDAWEKEQQEARERDYYFQMRMRQDAPRIFHSG